VVHRLAILVALWFATTLTAAGTGGARFIAHPIPSALAHPYIVVSGADGGLWFSESGADKIGRLDAASGAMVEFATPTPHSHPIGVIAGGDGNVWFSENAVSKVARITPAGIITEFDCPTANAGPNGMHRRPDGSIWFAESNADQIGTIRFDGRITEYGRGISAGAHPLSLVTRDNVLWFSEPDGDRLARLQHGVITEMPLAPHSQPRATTVDAHGNIWYVATGADTLVRLDRHNHSREFPAPDPKASLRSLAVAADGTIWFTEDIVNKIAAMRADGTLLAEYKVPEPMRGLRGMTLLPDGRVFFAAYDSGHIGELIPN